MVYEEGDEIDVTVRSRQTDFTRPKGPVSMWATSRQGGFWLRYGPVWAWNTWLISPAYSPLTTHRQQTMPLLTLQIILHIHSISPFNLLVNHPRPPAHPIFFPSNHLRVCHRPAQTFRADYRTPPDVHTSFDLCSCRRDIHNAHRNRPISICPEILTGNVLAPNSNILPAS